MKYVSVLTFFYLVSSISVFAKPVDKPDRTTARQMFDLILGGEPTIDQNNKNLFLDEQKAPGAR